MSIFPDMVHCISLWTLTHSVIKLVIKLHLVQKLWKFDTIEKLRI